MSITIFKLLFQYLIGGFGHSLFIAVLLVATPLGIKNDDALSFPPSGTLLRLLWKVYLNGKSLGVFGDFT